MNFFYTLLLMCLLSNSVIAATPEEARAQNLFMMVKCPTCAGQPIKESSTELALVLKSLIRNQIEQGKTDDEILEYLRASYGDQIVLKPEASAKTILLWLIPVFTLIASLVIVVKLLVQRRIT